MTTCYVICAIGLSSVCLGLAADNAPSQGPAYQNDFEKAEVGKLPEDFIVLEGAFAVQEEAGNKFVELPGAPLDTFGVLFGPTGGAGFAVTGRMHGTSKGRRFPAFAVGLNGQGEGSFRLQVTPAKKALELFRGETVITNAPFNWSSGSWTVLRLQVRETQKGQWTVEGKAWKQGDPEPAKWQIAVPTDTEPPKGRASIWGNPFSGTPIRYDDLEVQAAK